jgi:hypothetical protein
VKSVIDVTSLGHLTVSALLDELPISTTLPSASSSTYGS